MKVLVLGGSGFLGRHVVPALLAAGYTVRALARRPPAAAPGLEPFAGDALEAAVLERALEGVDAAVNLVGIHHGHGAQSFERIHVELPRKLAAAMTSRGVRRLVHLSVLCARPDPNLAYHDSKHRGDAVIQASPLDWTVLRPAIVYGADDGFTTRIARQLAQRVAPIPGRGDAPQAPVHVDDVALATVRCLETAASFRQTLPLCGSRTLAYADIVRELAAGRRVWMPRVPIAVLRAMARATRWMASPPLSEGQLAMIHEGMAADARASWSLLAVAPRGFDARLAGR